MNQPWTHEIADAMNRRITAECKRVAEAIGASNVVIIGFFPDGENMHIVDGGDAPMPHADLYRNLALVSERQPSGGPFRAN